MILVRKFGRWLDPRIPMGRAAFLIAQFLGWGAERTVLARIAPRGISPWLLFVLCLLLLYGALALVTVKRLADINWSRVWCLAILGPVLFDVLLVGVGDANSQFLKIAAYPIVASTVGYLVLVVLLSGMPGESKGISFAEN